MARLTVLAGVDANQRFTLDAERYCIGREATCPLRLHDTETSRQHAEFVREADGGYRVRDLNSANGVFVNNRPVREAALASGDRLQIGQTVLLYTHGEEQGPDLAERIRQLTRGDGSFASAIRGSVSELEGSRIFNRPDNSPWLRERLQHLNLLYEASQAVSHILDLDALLARILELIAGSIRADRLGVLLSDAETGTLSLKAWRSRDGQPPDGPGISTTIAAHVLREREGVLVEDAALDSRFRAGASIARFGIREAICVPLKGRREPVGVLYLDTVVAAEGDDRFSEDHLRLASAIAHQAALAIEETRYYQAMVQAERLAAVGQTMAALSHHIKNIMQGLQSGSEIITLGLSDNDTGAIRTGWRILEKNQKKIYDLVMEMLSYSKEREPGSDAVALNDIVEEIAELMRPRATERGVELLTDMEARLPTIPADREGVHRATLNLVSNAIDAAEGREPARVTLRTQSSSAQQLIVVGDTGPGIVPTLLNDIFKPFVSTKGARGTGLGLAVSRKVAREHGGDLTASSTVGVGSEFTLSLPSERDQATLPLDAPPPD